MEEKQMNEKIEKMPVVGFSLLIAGPLLLVNSSSIIIPEISAIILTVICFVLPGIGATISTIYLGVSKEKDKWSRVLAIATIIVCMPFYEAISKYSDSVDDILK